MTNVLLTGGSSGFGRALIETLIGRGDRVTTIARRPAPLTDLRRVTGSPALTTVTGDVTRVDHRRELIAAAVAGGPIDLVINNASELGGSPQPRLLELSSATFESLWRTNVDAPLQLIREARAGLAPDAVIVNLSSDAAIEHYPGWGGYGATKAALDHLTLTGAEEEPQWRWYAVDPGDMRTPMHQAAFPGADISDRPDPGSVVPQLLRLLRVRPASGRYRAAEFAASARLEVSA